MLRKFYLGYNICTLMQEQLIEIQSRKIYYQIVMDIQKLVILDQHLVQQFISYYIQLINIQNNLNTEKLKDLNSFCGTPEFLAPEVIKGESYGPEIDVWTFGCCIYEMLNGTPPFRNSNRKELYKQILMNKPKYPSFFTPQAISLLKNILKNDPKERLTLQQIKQHTFFEEVDWNQMYNKQYIPPIKPNLKGATDTKYFEKQNCSIHATPPNSNIRLNTIQFDGFTYQGSQMGGHLQPVKERDENPMEQKVM
ncbi:Protein kinase-like domain [Pseudocohnilembus persalinus]|uniref:Protein kinase-like domain n=1 Tax=Pseudocohnilembus persalinus TaxID=266149 RepID=A0A0V0QTY2_PSEPJ|nr:Protein kinase-like domain [Pseudocohnilembus persalinus]|eukprot:KRX05726.1 Protein kinase-like domain [Pseudocohnilembus persalinus]